MKKWLKRIRAALGMGFIWALGGIAAGGLPELADNVVPGGVPAVHVVDMWPQTLAIAGFLGGILFALVLGVLGGRRRFHEFSHGQFIGFGTLSGALLGVFLMVALGAPLAFAALVTALSAVGGSATLAVARVAERRGLIGRGADPELGDGDAPGLLR